MRVVQINVTCGSGSTGKICAGISEKLTRRGIENYILYCVGGSEMPNAIKYTDNRSIKAAALEARIKGNWGFEGKASTQRLIKELDRLKPDVVHLHNLHSHACRLDMLFAWLKKNKPKVFWTFHDCWGLTGYCMNYEMIGCDKWKSGCSKCPQRKSYSWLFDRSSYLHNKKKSLISDLDITFIAPSKWTSAQIQASHLSGFPVKVIYNGIDLSVFKPTNSDFKKKYSLGEKRVVLGVAIGWGAKKGLDVFIELSKRLSDDYRIVLVGTDESVERSLPKQITAIRKTQDQRELAQIYTAADVFLNATREEALGLTNIEALACGTPVVTFRSGGSPETVDETCGVVVGKDDIAQTVREITRICEASPFSSQACMSRARNFDGDEKFTEYTKLYFDSFK